jgi:hypothetical protein
LWPFSDEVEVAADLLGGRGQECRRELQAGALRQVGRSERIPDRAQILQFMLGRLKAPTQHGEICFSHCGLCTQARVQGLLAVLSIAAVDDVPMLGGNLGAQLPKVLFVLVGVFAHAGRGTVMTCVPLVCLSHRLASEARPSTARR